MRRSVSGFIGVLFLLAGLTLPTQAPAREPPLLQVITPALRERIDRLARTVELEDLSQESINLAGNATAFLVSQTYLSAGEEARLAGQMDQQILKRKRTTETPAAAKHILDRLLEQLPRSMKPEEFHYRLTVLDVSEPGVFTAGGGYIYLTRPVLERLLDGSRRGESALAFVLAQQLGHIARLHCRRGWQLAQIQQDLQNQVKPDLDAGLVHRLLETTVHFSGPLTYFLYSRQQSYEADLFAWQLCRNARIDAEEALDAMRYLVVTTYPRLLADEQFRPAKAELVPVLRYYFSESPEPLARLRRLLLERDGQVADEKDYGLFQYDSERSKWSRCPDHAIPATATPVVFVHGLRSDGLTFRDFVVFLTRQKEMAGRPLLVFRYPNNDSLARGGLFLHHEIHRVLAAPEKAAFICHSAGGLVFRYYAEIQKGAFGQAFLLATPHLGSQVTALKFLVDLTAFAGTLPLGLPAAIAATVPEGRGEIAYDLLPDSLFLRYLGYDPILAARYQVFCGRYLELDVFRSLALQTAIIGCRKLLKEQLVPRIQSSPLRERAAEVIDTLQLPAELLNGDGVVTVRSASLKNAGKVTLVNLDHLQIKQHEKVMRLILEALIKP